MRRTRRDTEIFSLSFLDCICCAFGAIILLFVLSKFAAPMVIENLKKDLSGQIQRLERERAEIRGNTTLLNRELTAVRKQLSEEKTRLARLQGDLSAIRGKYKASRSDARVQNLIEQRLARAQQQLTEEMKRLYKNRPRRVDRSVGGIPVDSEYIIFIIDTSGSMQRYAWSLMREKMRQVLKIYPRVKGIQVMNDMGRYLFSQYRGRWIPDSPSRRQAILMRLTTWRAFSNSSPVEGLTAAIGRFYAPDKKISIYVFGDEFAGGDIATVVDQVDRLNHAAAGGTRRVRIHAVGFPVVIEKTQQRGSTGERFATLMRILCARNGGTFVGLNSTTP